MAVAQCIGFDDEVQTTTANGGFLFRCRRGEIITAAAVVVVVGGLCGCLRERETLWGNRGCS